MIQVAFKVFRSATASWESLFQDAANFAATLRPGQLINLSHSEDSNEGVVTVWYWTSDETPETPASAAAELTPAAQARQLDTEIDQLSKQLDDLRRQRNQL